MDIILFYVLPGILLLCLLIYKTKQGNDFGEVDILFSVGLSIVPIGNIIILFIVAVTTIIYYFVKEK